MDTENREDDSGKIRVCADCGKDFEYDESDEHTNTGGDLVCVACSDEYVACSECGEVLAKDDAREDADGNHLCDSCFDEEWTYCDRCGDVIARDDALWNEDADETLCEDCAERFYYKCADCGEWIWDSGHVIETAGDTYICPDCYEEHYFTCESCNDTFPYDVDSLYSEEHAGYLCPSCYEESKTSRTIKDYCYKPVWNFHKQAHEPSNAFYLGVELEIENKEREISNDTAAAEVMERVDAVCKHDGSINYGFEIVMHPQTFSYATGGRKAAIGSTLSYLRNNGFRGHGYGGMHVHISLNAFSRLHIFKFHRLFREAKALFSSLSQRTTHNLEQWASFKYLSERPEKWSDNRYSALNYTGQTVEVRIFNSTLREDRFFKNLETCKAAIDYSKQFGIRDMNPTGFVAFIMENRHLYRNLAAFLVEKHAAIFTAVKVDRNAVKQIQKRISRRIA